MSKKLVLVALLSFAVLMSALRTANAATITSATLDKDVYLGGQTGYIMVTVYNDKDDKIRVTELTATINYYYADGTVYVQKFFTSATLPDEIPVGDSQTYQVRISLPTNIAHGYTNPSVEAKTEIWWSQIERWIGSDRATYQVKLYIESPYKQSFENSQQELQATQQQLQQEKTVNENLSNNVNMLGMTTMVFAIATGFLVFLTFARRPRPIPQHAVE